MIQDARGVRAVLMLAYRRAFDLVDQGINGDLLLDRLLHACEWVRIGLGLELGNAHL